MGLWLPGQAPEQTSPFAQRPVTTRQRWPYLRGQNPQLVISIKALHLQEHGVKHVNTGAQIQADWDLTKPVQTWVRFGKGARWGTMYLVVGN